ncbi:MAG: heavy metal translocating P-type ATPase [Treponema sp.]|uniref:heavy metal translocating P-type ATPase n=1 Tax=Treponema sp. TaxID=166 RepID=UPI001DDF7942|nr:heavy metal translocating P-type ATPase [Treponema sp.]MBS7242316.1 heavy metal translocating P-type ATPase [Treponema sp.]
MGCCELDHEHEEHGHGHEEEMSLKKIILSALLFAAGIVVEKFIAPSAGDNVQMVRGIFLALYFGSYILCGLPVIREAVEGLSKGKCFGEAFLMALATIGAVAIGETMEACAVMILFQLGEYLEDKASDKTKDTIEELLDIRPDTACVIRGGKEVVIDADDVEVGETIIVKPGELVPLDGIVSKGSTMVDTSALTGESVPREIGEGEEILSGFVNARAVIEIKVTKEFGESTVSKILDLIENAQGKKASTEKFITRFAKVYTPIVCILAVAVAVVPPTILGWNENFRTWLYRACEMLVVSCPCALVISVPLSFFAGIGRGGKDGILVKGSSYLEFLSRAETVAFDKTGTLTKGVYEVTAVEVAEGCSLSKDELAALVTHAEYYSDHPVSKSLKNFHTCENCGKLTVEEAEEISGHGIKCIVDGKKVLAGNKKLMLLEKVLGFNENIDSEKKSAGSVVYVAVDGVFAGKIIVSDVVKENAKSAIEKIHNVGIPTTVMLTGDTKDNAQAIADSIGIDEVRAELLPQGKVEEIERFMGNRNGGTVVFVGDGINDAPVLTRSDVGIAMGAMGSDSAIEAADIVIMDDNIENVALAIKLAKKTMINVKQNIAFSIAVKVAILGLCACGFVNMWLAVFGDVGVCLLTILNSIRLLKKK